MRIRKPARGSRPTLTLLVLLLGVIFVVSLTTLAVTGNGPTGMQALANAWADEWWQGNGGENNCDNGGYFHWILSAGGGGNSGFNYISGILHVVYDEGGPTQTSGNISANGAVHFEVYNAPGRVKSAWAEYEYVGTPGNIILTISHSACATTPPDTAPPATNPPATTPTVTTPTVTTPSVTTPSVTTPSVTTPTPTVHPETTVPSSESTTTTTSTTEHPLTTTPTPSQIQTGGGGTAGPGAGVWVLAGLAAALSIGLSASGLRNRQKAKQ